MAVADQHHVGHAQPFVLQRGQLDLDHDHPERASMRVEDRLREEVAGHAGGHADAVETALALRQGLLHVGAEAVVGADVAAGQAPVAGGQGHAVGVDQGQGRGAGDVVGAFQLQVQLLLGGCVQRMGQGVAQFRIQRQHLRQGAVAVDALLQGLRIQLQLLPQLHALGAQRALFGDVLRRQHRQHHAADDDDQQQDQATMAQERGHAEERGDRDRISLEGAPPFAACGGDGWRRGAPTSRNRRQVQRRSHQGTSPVSSCGCAANTLWAARPHHPRGLGIAEAPPAVRCAAFAAGAAGCTPADRLGSAGVRWLRTGPGRGRPASSA
ncbi:hypothetical protein NB723_003356 [Xanthomonas sacchari]|nr:hypothetical protein [Xanthomonas sacchari]